MHPIRFRSSSLVAYDEEGGAHVRLRTNRKAYGLSLRAFTQSDANVVFGSSPASGVPTDVASYMAYLEEERLQRVLDSPSWYASRVDNDLFSRVETTNPGAIRILAGETPSDQAWDPTADEAWIHTGAGSKADVVGLPAQEDETPDALFDRLRDAYALMERLPAEQAKEIAPIVRLDSRHFVPTIERLVDAGALMVLIEFHGWAGAVGNLGQLHEILLEAENPPYVVGTNVPPYASDHSGSGTLLASKFGIQAVAPRVFRGDPTQSNKTEQQRIDEMWWFSRSHGGYIRSRNLPAGWHDGCNCPDASTDLAAVGLEDLYAVRRRHTLWAHLQDVDPLATALDRRAYTDAYLDKRPLLSQTVDALS